MCITHKVEHNYILPSSTVGIQLHVSALHVGHLQVEIQLTVQLYKMCGAFCLGIGWGERDLVSTEGTMTPGCYRWIFSSRLCTHVKWVTVLMSRVCYNWYHSKIYCKILKRSNDQKICFGPFRQSPIYLNTKRYEAQQQFFLSDVWLTLNSFFLILTSVYVPIVTVEGHCCT